MLIGRTQHVEAIRQHGFLMDTTGFRLKRNDLCQESIHSRRAGSDGKNEVKSLLV
jgi:hypothetical protein